MSNTTHKLLLKSIQLLEEIANEPSRTSIQSLARRTDLSYASAYRIVHTFLQCDWLKQNEEGQLTISRNLPGRLDRDTKLAQLVERASPIIDRLTSATSLTGKLTVRKGEEAVSLYRKVSSKPTSISTVVGSAFHLCGGSSGATLMAQLSDNEIRTLIKHAPSRYWNFQKKAHVQQRVKAVRQGGVCFDKGQFNPDLFTVSTPLFNTQGRILAAITLMGFPSEFSPHHCHKYRKLLLEAGEEFVKRSPRKEIRELKMTLA